MLTPIVTKLPLRPQGADPAPALRKRPAATSVATGRVHTEVGTPHASHARSSPLGGPPRLYA